MDMEIYLVRHTTPDVAKGICYGQADIDVTATFLAEAAGHNDLLAQLDQLDGRTGVMRRAGPR